MPASLPAPDLETHGQEFPELVELVAEAWIEAADASAAAGRLPGAESAVRVVARLLGESSMASVPVALRTVESARAAARRVAWELNEVGEVDRARSMETVADGFGRGWGR